MNYVAGEVSLVDKKQNQVTAVAIKKDFRKLFFKGDRFDNLDEFEDGSRELPKSYFESLSRLAKVFSEEFDRIYFEQCAECGRVFMPLRSDAKTCNINCRVRASAKRRKKEAKQGG